MQSGRSEFRIILALLIVVGLAWSSPAWADDHVSGVVTGRAEGGTVVVQTDSGRLAIVIDDASSIHRIDGIRPIRVTSADLVPGLRIRAAGHYDTPSRFNAQRITFTKGDFRTAAAIQAGVIPTDQRSLTNEKNIQQHAQVLDGHERTLGEQKQQLTTQQGQITDNEQKIVATSGALAATNARIANLDDYVTVKAITVYFGNGKAIVPKEYKAQLEQLAVEARGVHGYMISVAAHASAIGSEPANQKLSMERANNVTAILQQSGVPLANVVVPAAMGTTQQISDNKTSKGQSENRRAIVSLLQNKGIGAQ